MEKNQTNTPNEELSPEELSSAHADIAVAESAPSEPPAAAPAEPPVDLSDEGDEIPDFTLPESDEDDAPGGDVPPDEDDDDLPTRKKGKTAAIVIAATVGALVAGGAIASVCLLNAGGAFREDTLFRNTILNGVDCTGMTVDEACAALTADRSDYTLTITEAAGTETISGADIELKNHPDSTAVRTVLDDQNADKLGLLKQYFSPADYEIPTADSYDGAKAAAVVSALTCLDPTQMTAPVNAELVNGEDDYYISPSSTGTQLDTEAAAAAIYSALDADSADVDLVAAGVYAQPEVTEDDPVLLAELAQIQALTSACITYDFGSQKYVCDSKVIKDFVVKGEDGTWGLDDAAVKAWVTQMANETDTYGKPHSFTTHAGNTIELTNGTFGWQIKQTATAEQLTELIEAGETTTVEPKYARYGAVRSGANDIGSTYAEVDISNQKVYLYVKGQCVLETDCVTGTATVADRATPSNGIWSIAYKKSPAVLGTMEKNGYESPVTYWMPFNGGVGFHDADGWRSSYGGTIYKYSGSHGCVNLPTWAAKTMYENISAGCPVVVYGS